MFKQNGQAVARVRAPVSFGDQGKQRQTEIDVIVIICSRAL